MAVEIKEFLDAKPATPGLRKLPMAPDMGRSVKIVDTVKPVDPNDTPHPRNSRGELGPALQNYYRNRTSKDPMGRIGATNNANDRRNVYSDALNRMPKGAINPDRVEVKDAATMTAHIKAVAKFFGADIVGVAKASPEFMYWGSRSEDDGGARAEDSVSDSPADLCEKYPYLIVLSTAWDYDTLQAHRHHIGDASYHFSQIRSNMLLRALEGYIRELGYTALRGTANAQAAAIAAGLGELGRNGLVITPDYGARVHMPPTIQTDLPLVAGKPIDIGLSDFCKVCRKCAVTCPTNSISFGDKVVFNGVEKYKINWLTCYRLRPYVTDYWESCLTCVAICPYTKPNTWWHHLAVGSLRNTPIPIRPLTVHALKWIDDKFWGIMKNTRVRFMGYDSGIKPGERACTIEGCTAAHEEAGTVASDVGALGYYFPLKENTNRFVKRG